LHVTSIKNFSVAGFFFYVFESSVNLSQQTATTCKKGNFLGHEFFFLALCVFFPFSAEQQLVKKNF